MAKTFCGKNCDECTYKEELNCRGCENGPGNTWTGNCKIAKCCDDNGYENCETCSMKAACGTLRRKHIIPQERIKELQSKVAKQERIQKKASVLGKWLPILFWTMIASVIAGFLASDSTQQYLPKIYLIGALAENICGLILIFILFKISPTSKRYKTAAWATLIATIGSFLTLILFLITLEFTFALLVFALSLVSLYAKYAEFKGHSEILEEVDPNLSEKWDKLIKWYIICNIGLLASFLLTILPILAILAVLISSVGMLIISVAELIFLYKTAKIFKSISQQ